MDDQVGQVVRTPDRRLDLWCSAEVNGSEVGRDVFSNVSWTFEEMISYACRDSCVLPGDLLGSGTVGNDGLSSVPAGRTLVVGQLVGLPA